jgi:hypothetical protein
MGFGTKTWIAIGAAALFAAQPSVGAALDPVSGAIDPPPGPLDYVKAFPSNKWVFGKLLWQGGEPCTEAACEAAYNADPLSILVQRQNACCGGSGYSITVIGRVANCSGSSYYLVWSKDLDRLNKADKLSLLSRHVASVANSINSECGVRGTVAIPTEDLERLLR